ncbi:hypothetical protein H0H92_012506, partial [Tricholoma furcatifolium]
VQVHPKMCILTFSAMLAARRAIMASVVHGHQKRPRNSLSSTTFWLSFYKTCLILSEIRLRSFFLRSFKRLRSTLNSSLTTNPVQHIHLVDLLSTFVSQQMLTEMSRTCFCVSSYHLDTLKV